MAGAMIVPSLMPFLSLVLPVRLNRWLNIIFGGIYSLMYDCRIQEQLVLLYPLRRNRNHTDTTYRLVCVDLAQGGKQPVATSGT